MKCLLTCCCLPTTSTTGSASLRRFGGPLLPDDSRSTAHGSRPTSVSRQVLLGTLQHSGRSRALCASIDPQDEPGRGMAAHEAPMHCHAHDSSPITDRRRLPVQNRAGSVPTEPSSAQTPQFQLWSPDVAAKSAHRRWQSSHTTNCTACGPKGACPRSSRVIFSLNSILSVWS